MTAMAITTKSFKRVKLFRLSSINTH